MPPRGSLPATVQAKATLHGGGGGFSITRPTRREKLYNASLAIYVYPDGTVEVGKNRNGDHGEQPIEEIAMHFSRILASMKLKEAGDLKMFKEGLTTILYEAIDNVLKGDHYETAIRRKSGGHGVDTDWRT